MNTSRITRANPGGSDGVEKIPEEEGLRDFIKKAIADSQAVLLDKIEGLENYIETMKEQHQLDIAKLKTEHDNKIAEMAEQISDLEAKVARHKKKRVKGELALDDQEQRGRRWNVRIPKVPVLPDETNTSLKTQLVKILSDAGAQIGLQDVVRCHRSGKTAPLEESQDPQEYGQCILAVDRWDVRESLHLARKKAFANGYGIRQDLTKHRLGLLTSARDTIKTWNIPKEATQVYAYANINCDLVMRKDKQVRRFHDKKSLMDALEFFAPQ